MSMPEIEPMLVLVTNHLTDFTCNTFLPAHDGAVWEKGEYGWFVYVVEDDVDNDVPEDLRQCMEYARSLGCFWIMFDRDGSAIDQLPTYDW
jgi:hypothetical protein